MRLRVAHACQPNCTLCGGAVVHDAGAVEPLLQHAEQTNQRRVYLQGTDVATHPQLAAIVRSARHHGLQVAVVDDHVTVSAGTLRQLGVAHLYVSWPTTAPSNDASVGSTDPRKHALASLLALSRDDGVAVGVHLPLNRRTMRELPGVLRVQSRLSIQDLLISDELGDSAAPDALDAAAALAALERIWLAANAAQVRLRCIGFERTRYVNPPIGEPAPSCDDALLETVRHGIPLPAARAGIRLLGGPDQPSNVSRLATSADQLRGLGLELAARRCPIVDLPSCLGGTQLNGPVADSAAPFRKSDACPTCPLDEQCPGASSQLDTPPFAPLQAALRPLPTWYSLPGPPNVLILSSLGGDPLFYKSTLPAVGDALRRCGAGVEVVSPWLRRWRPDAMPPLSEDASKPVWMGTEEVEGWFETHDLGRFDLVITSDFPTARVALAARSLRPSARIVVTDFHMLEAMDLALTHWLAPGARAAEGGWWPSEQLILESGFPGYLQLYLNYGVPLEQLAWRPYSLCPGHFPSGGDVRECGVIFSGGNHLRDLETLRAATERLPAGVHPVDLYAPGDRFEGNAHLRHRGQVDIASFCQAVASSRFMVLPVQEDPTRAAGITVLAMALIAGRPVVATSTAATRDYLQHGVDALLVPPGDPDAMAEAITRLDTDAGLLSTLAEGARRAGERMSTEHWAEEIVSGRPLLPRRTALGWRNW